jgi:protein O-mannosyl-transferase
VEGWIRGSLLHSEVQPAAWTLIAAAVILVAVCFANSVPNGFILDDHQIVAVNPGIRSVSPLRILATPYWGHNSTSGLYRPLTIFSFALEYPLWHRWPGGYRLTNLALHAINGLLLFVVARGLLQSVAAACAASAIYLAHPVHTEPVVGLVGRSELLAAMFFLLAWIWFRQEKHVLCAVAFLFSLLSKENAIVLPAVLLLDDWISRKKAQKPQRIFVILAPLCGYLAMRLWVLGGLGIPKSSQYLAGSLTLFQRELTSGRAFLKYFQLLVAPIEVTGDYDFNSIPVAGPADWIAWAGLLSVAAAIILALRIRNRQPGVAFGILFFFVAMLPSSNWIMPTSIIMSERALYIPSIGICLAAGVLWTRIASAERRTILAVGVMAVAAVLCIGHNYVWRDDVTYFGNMVRVLPDNVRGRQGYGVALVEAGLLDEAREQFEAGLKIKRNAPLLVGLAEAFMHLDRNCERARPVLHEALALDRSDPFVRWLIGGCFEREGRMREAEQSYRLAVTSTQFPDPKLLSDWARALESTGRSDEARAAVRRAAILE